MTHPLDCWETVFVKDMCIWRVRELEQISLMLFQVIQSLLAPSKIAIRDCLIRLVCLSVRPSAWNNSAPTGRIFMKFDIWVFSENLSRIFKFYQDLTRITVNLHEDWYIFFITSGSVLLRMRNASSKSCRWNQSIHFMFSNFLSILLFMR
jgi:hypothetical protein